jgi:hypothetical protein
LSSDSAGDGNREEAVELFGKIEFDKNYDYKKERGKIGKNYYREYPMRILLMN